MIKKLLKKYFNSKTIRLNDVKNTPNTNYKFILKYQNKQIGNLEYLDHKWLFSYTEWFKKQNEIEPLLEFPKKKEQYTSNKLWHFFANRIPSLKQPSMKKFIEKNPTYKENSAELLGKFGKYSVNNPFVLELAY